MTKGVMSIVMEQAALQAEKRQTQIATEAYVQYLESRVSVLSAKQSNIRNKSRSVGKSISTEGLFDIFKKKKEEPKEEKYSIGKTIELLLSKFKSFETDLGEGGSKSVSMNLGCLGNLKNKKDLFDFFNQYLVFLQNGEKYQKTLYATFEKSVAAAERYCKTNNYAQLEKDFMAYLKKGPRVSNFVPPMKKISSEIAKSGAEFSVLHDKFGVYEMSFFEAESERSGEPRISGRFGFSFFNMVDRVGLIKPSHEGITYIELSYQEVSDLVKQCQEILILSMKLYCYIVDPSELKHYGYDSVHAKLYSATNDLYELEEEAGERWGDEITGDNVIAFDGDSVYDIVRNVQQELYSAFGWGCMDTTLAFLHVTQRLLSQWAQQKD